MTSKYEFDAERWLRNWSARKRSTLADGRDPFAMCADEIHRLRMAVDLHEQGAELMRGENKALRARVAKLEEALKRGIELHENCDADTCMCGESMLHPLSDHKPTAMLQYYGDQWVEEARRALEEK